MKDNVRYSVIIPAYNEETVISETCQRLKQVMEPLNEPLIDQWRQGYDVVYAKRSKRLGETFFKRMTASFDFNRNVIG